MTRGIMALALLLLCGLAAPAVLIVGEVARPGVLEQSTLLLEKINESIGNTAQVPAYQ